MKQEAWGVGVGVGVGVCVRVRVCSNVCVCVCMQLCAGCGVYGQEGQSLSLCGRWDRMTCCLRPAVHE